jgi:reductive dehalogenase
VFCDARQPAEADEAYLIPRSMDRVIVMAVSMDLTLTREAPGAGGWTSAELGYSAMGCMAISLSEYIRALGYQAIPCMNDTALSIPLAVAAGLGQLGRSGMLISPEYGSCLRLCKVITDMPLDTDHPIDFGVTEFCDQCLACAKACPAHAISSGGRTSEGRCAGNNPGVEKWYVDVYECLRFWQANGAPCASCIAACPFVGEFAPSQCGECESCVAPDCILQQLLDLRSR